ncbi:hypothetical protein PpBr36_02286 [Pyricularia pennisetigena]|uniref:hypothetical protein n=1 Tax=Pyricularia pennisetigena TaxID=1578925 RepID=UPI00114E5803|nr:hypothetical protein PpBr36_02286 [Pyricularia pennisetigena]TLS30175.1 hypothetical protein PpBr36_02286 [Pyricularia pennisetigena]
MGIFPVKILRERISALLMLSVVIAAAAYGISLYYTPLFFAFTQNVTPLETGLDLIPFIGNFIGIIIIANILLSRFRLYAPLCIVFKAVAAGDAVKKGDYITAFITLQILNVTLFIFVNDALKF